MDSTEESFQSDSIGVFIGDERRQDTILHRLQSHNPEYCRADGIGRLELSISQFYPFVKYLGVYLGRDTTFKNWEAPLNGFRNTVLLLKRFECGFNTKVALYHVLCAIKFSFMGQFFPPSPHVLKMEVWASQILQRGPWNAIPLSIMINLKAFGLPHEMQCITMNSRAAMVRCATRTVLGFKDAYAHLTEVPSRDTVILASRH